MIQFLPPPTRLAHPASHIYRENKKKKYRKDFGRPVFPDITAPRGRWYKWTNLVYEINKGKWIDMNLDKQRL